MHREASSDPLTASKRMIKSSQRLSHVQCQKHLAMLPEDRTFGLVSIACISHSPGWCIFPYLLTLQEKEQLQARLDEMRSSKSPLQDAREKHEVHVSDRATFLRKIGELQVQIILLLYSHTGC